MIETKRKIIMIVLTEKNVEKGLNEIYSILIDYIKNKNISFQEGLIDLDLEMIYASLKRIHKQHRINKLNNILK